MTKNTRRFVSNGMGMIVSQPAYSTRKRTALWLWFAVFSVMSFAQPFAVVTAEARVDRDITTAIMRQEMRRGYSAVDGELSCADQTAADSADAAAPCRLQLKDRSSGQVYSLQGVDSSDLTREFLAGKRKTATVEGEVRADGSSLLVRIVQ